MGELLAPEILLKHKIAIHILAYQVIKFVVIVCKNRCAIFNSRVYFCPPVFTFHSVYLYTFSNMQSTAYGMHLINGVAAAKPAMVEHN